MRKSVCACVLLLGIVVASAGARAAEFQKGGFRFSVGPAPAFVIEHPVPEAWTGRAAPDPKWRTWLNDRQVDRRQGRDLVYTELAYQVLSPSLLGQAGRFQVDFDPEYQTLTFHGVQVRRDGAWIDRLDPKTISLARRESGFEQGLTNGAVTALLVLPDLRVGDLVRISYSIDGANPVLAGQEADWIRFDWVNPVLDAWLRVLRDPGTRLEVHRENGAPEAMISERDDAVEVVMHRHDAPAVVDEGDYPAWYQPYSLAQVAPRQTWAEVVAWALPLYPQDQPLPPDLEARALEWAALPGPRERLAAALRLVQDEVRYFGREIGESTHRPSPPADTWARRYGDCKDKAQLLATLLRQAGIDAVPALVSMGRGRAVDAFVPSGSDFDHVVVRARIGDRWIWVDPTASLQGGDPRASDLSDFGMALPIEPGRDSLQAVEPGLAVDQGITVEQAFTLSAKGDTALAIVTTYRGKRADAVRRMLAHNTVEELSRQWADFYRKQYGQLRQDGPIAVNDDRDANVVRLSENYVLAQPFIQADSRTWALDVNAESLQGVSAMPDAMSRKGPLLIGDAPLTVHHDITFRLPEGWAFGNTPEDIEIDASPSMTFSRSSSREDDAMTLAFDFALRRDFLEGGKVADHLAALRKVRESLTPRVMLSVPAGIGEDERERRLGDLLRSVIEKEAGP